MNRSSVLDFDDPPGPRQRLAARLLSMRVGAMLVRNTIVSCFVFVIGLAVLWVLVTRAGLDQVISAGIGFLIANSLHYLLGRSWIFRGSDRRLDTGYVFFVINAGVGLIVTMSLFAILLEFTELNYLVARVLVSVVAGLIVFALNAVLNFRLV